MFVRYAEGIVSSLGFKTILGIDGDLLFNCEIYFNGESEMAQ